MASWMAYGALVGLLFSAGSALLEKLLRTVGLPGRLAWVLGLFGGTAVPIVSLFTDPGVGSTAGPALPGPTAPLDLPPLLVVVPTGPTWLDPVLIAIWAAGTLLVLSILVRSSQSVMRRSERWVEGKLHGYPVAFADAVGPAVYGLLRPVIVVPRWLGELDEEAQRLVVVHEGEHVEAGDTLLLLLGVLASAALPWSPGIWLQLYRLKEAIEVDCDARVVRRLGRRRRYGQVLLEVADRIGVASTARMPFSVASPPLERRLRMITGCEPRLDRPAAVVHLLGSGAILLVVLAVPSPTPPSLRLLWPVPQHREIAATIPAAAAGATARPQLLNRHLAPRILERAYPVELRDAGIGGTVVLWAYVSEEGTVRGSSVLESSGVPELDAAAEHALGEFRYRPARTAAGATSAWTAQSVSFIPPSPSLDSGPPARLAIWRTPAPAPTLVSMR
jgi:bla regulator protein blaR1